MTKCYGHEECEYNAQPNCALPNGMECPHRVKADKPAAEGWTDIEALIERLNQYSQSLIAYQMGGEFADVCMDAATALSTLQAETEKLQSELEKVKKALAMMWFAYGNKDGEFPHEYEIEAMKTAEEILGPWEECMPKYLRRSQKED